MQECPECLLAEWVAWAEWTTKKLKVQSAKLKVENFPERGFFLLFFAIIFESFMKKILLLVAPLLIATLIFFGILFFFDRKNGKGALQVTSVPNSKVYLNNKLMGTTPFCACEAPQTLTTGDYTVKLVPVEGNFGEFEEKITINESTLTVVDRTFADSGESSASIISLIPLKDKKDIELLAVSLPEGANVFLDNNPVGVTPLLLKEISESDHDLRITRDGYKDKSLKIKTALGYKLSSVIFLGINPDLSSTSEASEEAVPSPTVSVPKVVILDTPTGFLRVRENNSISSLEIAKAKPGETYEYVSEAEGWFEIKLKSENGEEKTGWVSASYAVKE